MAAGLGSVAGAVALAVGLTMLAAASVAAEKGEAPALAADPHDPGPRLPPEGRSLFDELFELRSPGFLLLPCTQRRKNLLRRDG